MSIRAVVFDLDGTLLDTLDDLATAANAALKDGGHPVHSTSAYRHLVGGGAENLFEMALPRDAVSPEEIARTIAAFRAHYELCWRDKTRPYVGIEQLISKLTDRGIPLAVLSNKPHDFTRACVREFFAFDKGDGRVDVGEIDSVGNADLGTPIGPFTYVVGQRPGVPVKPDPSSALEIASQLELLPAEILYVGDTSIDVQTALAAGMPVAAVLWGFRDEDELVRAGATATIREPLELLNLIDGSSSAGSSR